MVVIFGASGIDDRVGMIGGDGRKVKQVLLNLLSNALKFTPEGGRIDVHTAMKEGMAEISVADTGVGIAPEDQEAIFEEFRQVVTAATPRTRYSLVGAGSLNRTLDQGRACPPAQMTDSCMHWN